MIKRILEKKFTCADCPKQYCMMGGKQITDYAIDAAGSVKSTKRER